jgi:hypothetical protein
MSDKFYQKKFVKDSVWFAAPTVSDRRPFYFIVVRARPLDIQIAIYDFDSGEIKENYFFHYDEMSLYYIVTRID